MSVYEFKFLDGECFWGGSTVEGCSNPFTATSVQAYDFTKRCFNQTMPLFLSNKGRYIWSDHPFIVTFMGDGTIRMEGKDIQLITAGTTLRDAYLHAMNTHFPFDGKQLPEKFFTTAQYNSWMEFTYHPTQKGILEYAHNIIDHGFEPGILIIDEGWHGRYGNWEFDRAKFPDPKAMMDELHELGFTVMLWVVPVVCPDGQDFVVNVRRDLNKYGTADEIFTRNAAGEVAVMRWWNGLSAILDMRKQTDREFLDRQLHHLMQEYGVDGFKFDGGDVMMYHRDSFINGPLREDHDPHAMNEAWNEFGRRYEYHEYKDTYKGGGKNCIQRLNDRLHRWKGDGVDTVIPCSILQGLMGTPFTCPDMIGGGEWSFFANINGVDFSEELFVRMAQASALCPMMQFSLSPWRLLSPENFAIVKRAAMLHKQFAPTIVALVKDAERTGEPILRNLEYNDPHQGYEHIMDEFMLGKDILVSPVLTPNTTEKDVVFPAGIWLDEDGNEYIGRQTYRISTPLSKLAYFMRKS